MIEKTVLKLVQLYFLYMLEKDIQLFFFSLLIFYLYLKQLVFLRTHFEYLPKTHKAVKRQTPLSELLQGVRGKDNVHEYVKFFSNKGHMVKHYKFNSSKFIVYSTYVTY